MTEANEYLKIQLKLFRATYLNGENVSTNIIVLKLNDVPTTNLVINGSQYMAHAVIFLWGKFRVSSHYI